MFSVSQLSQSIRKNLLANNPKLADVWIEGEVSGFKPYPSGHFYFTLKDEKAQINVVLFSFLTQGCDAGFRTALAEGPQTVNGLKILVRGELDLSMARGTYSFKAFAVKLAGLGDKMAQYNALRARLEEEGLDKLDHPELRRPLPFLPHRIGLVTSEAGAVIHDMCTVLTRRFPNLEIRLFPSKVQGEGAAASIAAGVDYFSALYRDPEAPWRPDVVIVGRGGGSAEDLWCFNEEPVVYAVARSAVPIISAVGHESDVTLCDYVADLRAGTPSIAAECAVPVKRELTQRVAEAARRLGRAPMARVETWTQQLDYLALRLAQAPREKVGDYALRLNRAKIELMPPLRQALDRAAHRLARAEAALKLLNPLETLKRGYSITLDGEGRVVTRSTALRKGDALVTRLADGDVASVVA